MGGRARRGRRAVAGGPVGDARARARGGGCGHSVTVDAKRAMWCLFLGLGTGAHSLHIRRCFFSAVFLHTVLITGAHTFGNSWPIVNRCTLENT